MNRKIITAETIRAALRDGETAIAIGPGDIVTQQAEDDARRQGIALISAEDLAKRKAEEARRLEADRKAEESRKAAEAASQPAQEASSASVVESVATPVASAAPVAPVAGGVTPEQMVTAVVSQLQQALAPLTNALPKLLAGGSLPTVSYAPGLNPMAAAPVAAAPVPVAPTTPVAPVAPAAPVASAAPVSSASSVTEDPLIAEVRRRVLAALPKSADPSVLDELIRKTVAASPDANPVQGGNVTSPAVMTAPGQSIEPSGAGVEQVKGVMRVNSKAQQWGKPVSTDSVTMMDVLTPEQGAVAYVGYLEWENQSLDWTFARPEVLVMLEGELKMVIEGTSITVQAGDVCSIPAGSVMRLEAAGHVKCTTVSGMCA